MAGGFIGGLGKVTFNSSVATAKIHQRLSQTLDEAVEAWVRTAESIIPVWSGMSRGTLVKLGDKVGYHVSNFTAPGAPDRFSEGIGQSDAKVTKIPGRYIFEYKSNVFHLAVNENANATVYGFNLKKPGPYHFRVAADAAFNDVMEQGIRGILGSVFLETVKFTNERKG